MKIKTFYGSVTALLAGLLCTQIIATIQVYCSNAALYRSLEVLKDEGYRIVPNEIVMIGLNDVSPAFFGGLFFTLTLGAGLACAGLACVWLWDRLCVRRTGALALIFLLWCLGVVFVNREGCTLFGTLYFGMIPPVVFLTALWIMPRGAQGRFSPVELIPLIPLVILAALWVPHMEARTFSDIRDNLLLTTSAGIAIAESYYRYTLYPAHAFKSLDQRLLKTCRLEGFDTPSIKKSLAGRLVHYDYLPVTDNVHSVDCIVSGSAAAGMVAFSYKGRTVLARPLGKFLAFPGDTLKEYSRRLDRHRFLRAATFSSLLFASPLLLYILIYAVIYALCLVHLRALPASIIASGVCLAVGVIFLGLLLVQGGAVSEDPRAALSSPLVKERIGALRGTERLNALIDEYRQGGHLPGNSPVAERYWLARALASGRSFETCRMLYSFLDDPNPMVRYVAFNSLGKRGGPDAVGEIERRIPHLEDWYSQLYAYKALRKLGWTQKYPHTH